jgi:hypothetical protein
MRTFIIQWNARARLYTYTHKQTQMMSVKSRHFLLLFYKISVSIYTFLPELRNLKNASAVEVRFSSSQPASHGFLDCLVSLVAVKSQVIFQEPEQVVVWGSQIQTVEWMGEQFPAVLCSSAPVSKRGTQREQTSRYPKISIISWTVWCTIPSCSAVPLTVILHTSLKYYTHLLTLLTPIQASPYTPRSHS